MEKSLIKMSGIVKIFPPDNVALKKVDLEIKKGEIHSIIGENGAGKSTLLKVLYGLEKANQGEIFIHGEQQQIHSPKEAVAKGIGMVHQEFMLIGVYTVLENIVLGYEPHNALGFLKLNQAREKLQSIFEKFRFDVSLDERVENLSVAAQQKIEIVKLLYRDVDILILDEPTAVLAPQEADELFKLLEQLKEAGKTIIFISHKLDEVLRISDTITVMRRGERIWTRENKGLDKVALSNAMVGRDVMLTVEKPEAKPGKVVLEFRDVSVKNPLVEEKLDNENVSFCVREGEIVGVAGVEGNGQYEMIQALIGTVPVSKGEILINDSKISDRSIRERRYWISYISQDRKGSGSSQTDSIGQNTVMTHHYVSNRFAGFMGLLSVKKQKKFAETIIQDYQVVCKSLHSRMNELSGGNQQKVIIGREIEMGCPLLVADQPVRGLDVGSIEYIHKKIVEERNEGVAVLLVSADLDELFSLSDRILVFYKGRIVAQKVPCETSKEEIGEFMLGVRSERV